MYFVAKIFGGAKVVLDRRKSVEYLIFKNCLTSIDQF